MSDVAVREGAVKTDGGNNQVSDVNIKYGRLQESVHVSTYTMERACSSLEYLLDDNRWRRVGQGFADIDAFLRSIDLSDVGKIPERRKAIAKKLEALQATQRATAKALGVSHVTIGKDLGRVGNKLPEKADDTPMEQADLLDAGNKLPPAPDVLDLSGADVAKAAEGKARAEAKKQKRSEKTEQFGETSGTFKIGVGRFQDCKLKDNSVDLIITDPPYPEEYLPEWSDLSAFAARVLKPGGSLLAMSGQHHLPEVIRRLGEHMTYHWTLAYLTPGGQSAQNFSRQVNPFWKPILWYVKGDYSRDWIGDVVKSDVNANEKDSHEWQQSVSGMIDLCGRFVGVGDTVVDPFCGSGTTGVAVLGLVRDVSFIGIEIDAEKAAVAERRLNNATGA